MSIKVEHLKKVVADIKEDMLIRHFEELEKAHYV